MTLITPGFTPEYEILSIRPRSLFGSHPEQKVPYLPLASIRARFETLPVNEVYSEYRKHEIVDVGCHSQPCPPQEAFIFFCQPEFTQREPVHFSALLQPIWREL